MLLTAPKALDNAEVPEVWGHTEMRRDRLWSCFEVSSVYFTQQGKYIFKIPLGFLLSAGFILPKFSSLVPACFPSVWTLTSLEI